MSFADLAKLGIPTEEVPVPSANTSFTVRGLAMGDVSKLLKFHGAALNALYLEQIVNSDIPAEQANIAALGRAALETVPDAAIAAIALAADAEDRYDIVARLPISVQTVALEAILRLTFHTEEDLGNFVGAVLRGSESVQRVLKHALQIGPSKDGSKGSESQ